MILSKLSRAICLIVSLFAIVVPLTLTPKTVGASTGPTRTDLLNSIKPIAPDVATAPLNPSDFAQTMRFMVALRMRNFPELQARVSRGERISHAEMASKYYPLAADYTKVTNWLKTEGFQIVKVDPNHLGVVASGTIAQVQRALTTNFAKVSGPAGLYNSAITPPSVPSIIAPLVVGVNGLQPHITPQKQSQITRPVSNRIGAEFTPLIANAPPFLVNEIRKAYDADSVTQTGAGEKIAILIDTFPLTTDLTLFWALNGVNQSLNNIEFVQVVTGTLPPPTGEESLDVEWSSAIASGAKVRVYAVQDISSFVNVDQGLQAILADLPNEPTLHEVSISLGAGESFVSPSQLTTDSQYFAAMAAAGVTVLVSSGDTGSTVQGVTQVSYFASDPSVTAVGGTSLILSTCSGTTISETAWHGSGGGVSTFFSRPSWQVGSSVPPGNTRLVPDVSSVADPNTGGVLFLNGQQEQVGGTSWSAPVWAGFSALLNEARATANLPTLGLLGPQLYPLLGTTAFRDIVSGNNGVYSATVGYDLVTGLGSPSVATLLEPLSGGPTPPPSQSGAGSVGTGQIVSPDPQCALSSSTAVFTWTADSSITSAFWLIVGTTPGGSDIFSSGQTGNISATVTNLPVDGRSIYVRLWSLVGGTWFVPPADYVYTSWPHIVLTPVIAPKAGTYKKKVSVTITCATPAAAIYYTLDGSIPTTSSTIYTGPFLLNKKGTTTVRAIASKTGVQFTSPPVTATYTIK